VIGGSGVFNRLDSTGRLPTPYGGRSPVVDCGCSPPRGCRQPPGERPGPGSGPFPGFYWLNPAGRLPVGFFGCFTIVSRSVSRWARRAAVRVVGWTHPRDGAGYFTGPGGAGDGPVGSAGPRMVVLGWMLVPGTAMIVLGSGRPRDPPVVMGGWGWCARVMEPWGAMRG